MQYIGQINDAPIFRDGQGICFRDDGSGPVSIVCPPESELKHKPDVTAEVTVTADDPTDYTYLYIGLGLLAMVLIARR